MAWIITRHSDGKKLALHSFGIPGTSGWDSDFKRMALRFSRKKDAEQIRMTLGIWKFYDCEVERFTS